MKVFDSFGDNVTIPVANLVFPSHAGALPLSGDPVLVGRLCGVANADGVTGGSVVVSTRGVYNLSVTSIHNGVSIGETVYIDPVTAVLSDDANDVPFGVALDAVAAGNVAATVRVKLFGATPGAIGADS
jgi:predicted RecA/RadA family phage recombinase